jgi:hypothetical protein
MEKYIIALCLKNQISSYLTRNQYISFQRRIFGNYALFVTSFHQKNEIQLGSYLKINLFLGYRNLSLVIDCLF